MPCWLHLTARYVQRRRRAGWRDCGGRLATGRGRTRYPCLHFRIGCRRGRNRAPSAWHRRRARCGGRTSQRGMVRVTGPLSVDESTLMAVATALSTASPGRSRTISDESRSTVSRSSSLRKARAARHMPSAASDASPMLMRHALRGWDELNRSSIALPSRDRSTSLGSRIVTSPASPEKYDQGHAARGSCRR